MRVDYITAFNKLDTAEDPRPKLLYPERYVAGSFWKDLRGKRWSG